MFDRLEKYKPNNGSFYVYGNEELQNACNAPKESVGIYLIYKMSKGNINLVYIGSSGKMSQNGQLKIRQGGLYDRLVNGKQFEKARKFSWIEKINSENIDALQVQWFVTFSNSFTDIPKSIEGALLQEYFEIYKQLPEWNKEF